MTSLHTLPSGSSYYKRRISFSKLKDSPYHACHYGSDSTLKILNIQFPENKAPYGDLPSLEKLPLKNRKQEIEKRIVQIVLDCARQDLYASPKIAKWLRVYQKFLKDKAMSKQYFQKCLMNIDAKSEQKTETILDQHKRIRSTANDCELILEKIKNHSDYRHESVEDLRNKLESFKEKNPIIFKQRTDQDPLMQDLLITASLLALSSMIILPLLNFQKGQ